MLKSKKNNLKDWNPLQDWENFQDKIILWVGAFFSNHGTSWSRPVSILVSINIFISLFIVYSLACADWQKWLFIFAELFNPLSNLDNSIEKIVIVGNKYNVFSPWVFATINAFQKLFYAGLAYETIRVFRRFTVK